MLKITVYFLSKILQSITEPSSICSEVLFRLFTSSHTGHVLDIWNLKTNFYFFRYFFPLFFAITWHFQTIRNLLFSMTLKEFLFWHQFPMFGIIIWFFPFFQMLIRDTFSWFLPGVWNFRNRKSYFNWHKDESECFVLWISPHHVWFFNHKHDFPILYCVSRAASKLMLKG